MRIVLIIVVFVVFVGYAMTLEHQQEMYKEFNKQYLAAQILEIELQNRHNNTNITLEVYKPPMEVGL